MTSVIKKHDHRIHVSVIKTHKPTRLLPFTDTFTGPGFVAQLTVSTSLRISAEKETKLPLVRRLLHLLADPTDSRTALLLLSQDGHHRLGKEVCVLAVTHHLLQERGGNSSARVITQQTRGVNITQLVIFLWD